MANLQQKCSICLNYSPTLVSTMDTDTNQTKWGTKLSLCVPEVDWGAGSCICQDCVEQLEAAYAFRHLCLQSYEVRKQQALLAAGYAGNPETNLHVIGSRSELEHSDPNVFCDNDELTHVAGDAENADLKKKSGDSVTSKVTRKKPVAKSRKVKYPMKCEHCLKDFNRKQHLVAHIRRIHTLEKPYACNQCEERFPTSHNLLVHKNKHTNNRPFICSYCGKTFRTSSDLYHHMKIHLNKREYKCEICEKTFNTTSILRAHKICVHVDPKLWKYPCTFCDRRFPMKSGLTAHIRRHTGEKNFVCHICGKRFSDKDMVLKHFRSHTNERLYKCHLCANEYKASGGLNVHLKKVHDLGTASLPKPASKKYICHVCSKGFVTGNKLEKHIRSHTGERPFSCSCCGKKFTDGWYLKVHLRTKHGQLTCSDNSG